MAMKDFRRIYEVFKTGWKVEGNWTDPVLFTGFIIVRPLFTVLIAAFVYLFIGIATGKFSTHFLSYILIGSIFFVLPASAMRDLGWLVHGDREHYEVLKHIHITPYRLEGYLFGRYLMVILNSAVSVFVALMASYLILQVFLPEVRLFVPSAYLLLYLPLWLFGALVFFVIGISLYSLGLLSEVAIYALAEGLPGLFFIIGGVLYPYEALPYPFNLLALSNPVYYYSEVTRQLLWGMLPDMRLLAMYLLTGLIWAMSCYLIFSVAYKWAIKSGVIDKKVVW